MTERYKKSYNLSVALYEEERDMVSKAALLTNRSKSEYARRFVLEAARKDLVSNDIHNAIKDLKQVTVRSDRKRSL